MGVDDWEQRLSRISTKWTLMFQAHQTGDHETAAACGNHRALHWRGVPLPAWGRRRCRCGRRACPGIRLAVSPRRLSSCSARAWAVSQLSQVGTRQFGERSPSQTPGSPGPLPADTPDRMDAASDAEASFAASWREEVLERTWQTLAEANPTYHAVLLLHVQRPDLASPQMADVIAAEVGKPMNAPLVARRCSEHRRSSRSC